MVEKRRAEFLAQFDTLPTQINDPDDRKHSRELARYYEQKSFELRTFGTNFLLASNGAGLALTANGVANSHLSATLGTVAVMAIFAWGAGAAFHAHMSWRAVAAKLRNYHLDLAKGEDANTSLDALRHEWGTPIASVRVAMACLITGMLALLVLLFWR